MDNPLDSITESYLPSIGSSVEHLEIKSLDSTINKLPSYLLELKFGERLYADMLEAMTSSTSTLPALIESREAFKRKLAAFGIMGKFPQHFLQDDVYCDELINIFKSREVTAVAQDSTSGEIHVEDAEMSADTEKLVDRAPTKLISTQLRDEALYEKFFNWEKKFEFPLPSSWGIVAKSSFRNVKDKLTLITPKDETRSFSTSNTSNVSYRPSLAWSNKDIPVDCTVYYYEIAITEGLPASDISVGFLYENIDKYLNQLPGLDTRTFGYNGKEGKIYSKSDNMIENFGAKFGINDVIGCGINRYTNTIFYTKNGILLGDAFHEIKRKPLYACIGMGDFNAVKTNFGLRNDNGNFVFDIDNYVKGFKNQIRIKIGKSLSENPKEKNLIPKKRNGLRDEDIPDVLNSFVLSHLEHSGFGTAWRALVKDLEVESMAYGEVNSESSAKQTEKVNQDLAKRERIRQLLQGDRIDELITFLQEEYSDIFDSQDESIFKLKCLKLVNLIKLATLKKDNKLILKAIDFGKILKEEYKSDADKVDYLNDVSSLLAFEDPLNSRYGYLMRSLEIHKAFDELNKYILKKSDKKEYSILERIINQTETILAVLVEKNDNEAMLVNVGRDYLQFI